MIENIELSRELDPTLAVPLEELTVFGSFSEDPKIGRDGFFGDDWGVLGMLEEEAKFELNRVIDKTKIKAHKLGVVAVSVKPGELTTKVNVIGRNPMVDYIQWPDRDDNGKVLKHTNKIARLHLAFVMRNQNGEMEILATRHKAYLTMEDVGRELETAARTIDVDYVTGPQGDAFDRWVVEGQAGVAMEPLKMIRFEDSANSPDNAGKKVYHINLPQDATGGTYTITVDEQTTSALPFNTDAKTLGEKLAALSSVTSATVKGSHTEDFTVVLEVSGEGVVSANGESLTGTKNKAIVVNP